MRPPPSIRIAVTLAVFWPAFASAQIIQNNGTPDNLDGYNVTGAARTANDFTIAGNGYKKTQTTTTLTSFDFWALHDPVQAPSVTANFFWQILNDAGGAPGTTVVASGAVTNGIGAHTEYFCCGSNHFLDAYLFSVSLGDLVIGNGVFWLAIGGFTSVSPADESLWYWATSAQTGNQMNSVLGGPFENVPSEGAFVLYGTTSSSPITATPEPGTMLLMVSGLAGLAGVRIRRRRKS